MEALAGSRKCNARIQERARIVLLAAEGMVSRAVARKPGCIPGMVSKWRVLCERDRMARLTETGDRGAELKYGPEHDKAVLAMPDRPPPDGYANWTAPLPVRELGAALSLSGSGANCLSGTRSRLRSFGTARFTGLPALRPRRRVRTYRGAATGRG